MKNKIIMIGTLLLALIIGTLGVNNIVTESTSTKEIAKQETKEGNTETYPFTIKKVWNNPDSNNEVKNARGFKYNDTLAGAKFRITGTDESGKAVNILTEATGTDGLVTVNLPKPKDSTSYNITEEVVPEGFTTIDTFSLNKIYWNRFLNKLTLSYTGTSDTPADYEPIWVNAKARVGNIKITKKVEGTTDTSKEFEVEITLSDKSINGTYKDVTFTNGVGKIKIKHNETKEITNLPQGITYEVKETNSEGYEVTYTNEKGSIETDKTKEVTITNKYTPGTITFTKQWLIPEKYGKNVYNEKTKEYEWKVYDVGSYKSAKELTAKFEITFTTDVKDGEYEMEGANENKLVVKNNKATFSITTKVDNNKLQEGYGTVKSDAVTITGIPENTKYKIEETEATPYNDLWEWHQYVYPSNLSGINVPNQGYRFSPSKDNVKVNLAKKSINSTDKEKEYEFTLLPYWSETFSFVDSSMLGFAMYGMTETMEPDYYYSIWLHGEDGDKVVDKEWFVNYFAPFLHHREFLNKLYIYDKNENYSNNKLLSMFTSIYATRPSVTMGRTVSTLSDPFYECQNKTAKGMTFTQQLCFANFTNPNKITEVVNNVNTNTNNFFEYEGKQIIEASKRLQAEFKKLGYDGIVSWYNKNKETIDSGKDTDKLKVIDEFINCFINAKWTVDDFRYLKIMHETELKSDYKDIGLDKPLYETINEYAKIKYTDYVGEREVEKVLETIQYYFGRTFKLKDGESISLIVPTNLFANAPTGRVGFDNFLILEKKTEDMEYKQSNSIATSMTHFEKNENQYTANVTYKNTYPEKESIIKQIVKVPKTYAGTFIATIIGLIGLITASLLYYFKLSDRAIKK